MPHNITLERLGFAQDARVLMLHADDLGMSYGAHAAGLEVLRRGSMQSGSIMTPCAWFPISARACREDPDLDMGIHITLTSEWDHCRWRPLADSATVPHLVDAEGYMWRTIEALYQAVGDHHDEVAFEIQAQIDHALANGVQPTHMDSHMGALFHHPAFFRIACDLALKNDIPFMVFHYTRQRVEETLRYYNQAISDRLGDLGFPLFDDVLRNYEISPDEHKAREDFLKIFGRIGQGLSYAFLHPSLNGDELQNMDTVTRNRRILEYTLFKDRRMRETLEQEGIILIGWRELKEKVWDKRDKSVTGLCDRP